MMTSAADSMASVYTFLTWKKELEGFSSEGQVRSGFPFWGTILGYDSRRERENSYKKMGLEPASSPWLDSGKSK